MNAAWDWIATLGYPTLFALLGIYALLGAIGRCAQFGRWQCVTLFALGAVICAMLALTNGIWAFEFESWARPVVRLAVLGIIAILITSLWHEVRRMKP